MRAPLSIVIPTLNAETTLAPVLGSLGEGLNAGLIRELIISDGGSTDATLLVAEQAGARIIEGTPGRGGQLGRGAEASQGSWILFLHADTALATGWSEAVLSHLAQDKPGYFHLSFAESGLAPALVAGWANLRARLFGLPYGDQGLLISRKAYDAVGGYPEIPLMEDVAMSRALRVQMVAVPVTAITSGERYVSEGWIRRGSRNLWTLLRYLSGTDPGALAKSYNRRD